MRTSRLIAELARRLAEHGDLEVVLFDPETVDYRPVTHLGVTKTHLGVTKDYPKKDVADVLVLEANG